MSTSLRLAACLMVIFSHSGFGQKADIYGKWYFDRFGGPHGEIVKSGEIAKANKEDVGLSFTFTKEGKAIMERKDGATVSADFKVLAGGTKVIMHGDTMRVMLLTAAILELNPTSNNKPALFLKRSKDGKTAMSAP